MTLLLAPCTATQAQQGAASLAPLAAAGSETIQPPWKIETFPETFHKKPTQFSIETIGGISALRLATDDSYGTLAHPWTAALPGPLGWRWRLDEPLTQADIATKSGDDSALKVCVLFDQPLDDIPFFERTALQLARATVSGNLPAATVCYLWDNKHPAGYSGHNAFTSRVRFIVLRGPDAPLGSWQQERRDVAADFHRLFGAESPHTPPLLAVAVGADSDNTHAGSVGHIANLQWQR